MDENSKAVEEMEKPWEQKLQEEKERTHKVEETVKKEDRKVPNLANLNEDP